MAIDEIRQRLCNKAHVFDVDDVLCSRCGSTILDAVNTPFRCAGVGGSWQPGKQPMTLSQAINRAENPD